MSDLYMLDTDTASYVVKGRSPTSERMREASPDHVCLSAVVCSEMLYGLFRLPPEHAIHLRTRDILRRLRVVPWDEQAAERFADIRHRLTTRGETIGLLDMMIAAHALAQDAILVTNNTRHFSRLADLKLANWALR